MGSRERESLMIKKMLNRPQKKKHMAMEKIKIHIHFSISVN